MTVAACRYVHGGRVHGRRGTVFRPHAHPCHELAIPLRGRLRARIGGAQAEAAPGQVLWYPAGGEHFESLGPEADGDWLYVQVAATDGARWPLRIDDRAGTVRQLAAILLGETGTGPAAAAKRDALCAAILAELSIALAETAVDGDQLVPVARQFIRRHLAEPLPIERIARACGLSRAHFARAWRKRTGRTVQEAVRDARLAAARELLLATDLPLREIAPRVGLGSEHLLSRLLARHLGAGARTLRRARRPIAFT